MPPLSTEDAFPEHDLIRPDEVLDLLDGLVAKSMVQVESSRDRTRYGLSETMRDYALIHSDRLEVEHVRGRHGRYFLEFAEEAKAHLTGPDQAVSLQSLFEDYPNLRAGLSWHLTAPGGADDALKLCGALWRFWDVRCFVSEGREFLRDALQRTDLSDQRVRLGALLGAGCLAYRQGEYEDAERFLEQCIALASVFSDRVTLAMAYNFCGLIAQARRRYTAARRYYTKSIALDREIDNRYHLAAVLSNFGTLESEHKNFARSKKCLIEALAIQESIGAWHNVAITLNGLGCLHIDLNEWEEAARTFERSVEIKQRFGDYRGMAASLNNLGIVECHRRRFAESYEYLARSLRIRVDLNDRLGMCESLTEFGDLAAELGQSLRAVMLLAAADSLRREIGSRVPLDEREAYDQALDQLRSALGVSEFERAWQKGRQLTRQQAVSIALQQPHGSGARQ